MAANSAARCIVPTAICLPTHPSHPPICPRAAIQSACTIVLADSKSPPASCSPVQLPTAARAPSPDAARYLPARCCLVREAVRTLYGPLPFPATHCLPWHRL